MDYEGISQQISLPVASLQVYSSTHMHFFSKKFSDYSLSLASNSVTSLKISYIVIPNLRPLSQKPLSYRDIGVFWRFFLVT